MRLEGPRTIILAAQWRHNSRAQINYKLRDGRAALRRQRTVIRTRTGGRPLRPMRRTPERRDGDTMEPDMDKDGRDNVTAVQHAVRVACRDGCTSDSDRTGAGDVDR